MRNYNPVVSGSGNNSRNYAASFQPKSANSKLSHVKLKPFRGGRFNTFPQAPFVCSTYVSIKHTCPDTCKFKDAGCYVQTGQAGASMRRLERFGDITDVHPNKLEADLLDMQWNSGYHKTRQIPQDGAKGGRDLRLHVGGDVLDLAGAHFLAGAIERWMSRGGGQVWNYTHRWRDIPADAWGPISTLASVETPLEAQEAVDLGYMPSWTMSRFRSEKIHSIGDIKLMPCPAQTKDMKCNECRLCFKKLRKGTAIGFEWHGRDTTGKRRLNVIGQEMDGQRRLAL